MVATAGPLEAGKGNIQHPLNLDPEVFDQARPGAAVRPDAGPLGHPIGDERIYVARQVCQGPCAGLAGELPEADQDRNSTVNDRI